MWDPHIAYRGDQYISQAGQQISGAVVDAINKYKNDQEQQGFSDLLMHHLAETPSDPSDPNSAPIVPIDQLNDYMQSPLKKKVGMALAAQAGAATDFAHRMAGAKANLEQAQADRASALSDAQSNLFNAKANAVWTGQGEDGSDNTIDLSDEEKSAAAQAGKIPLRQSSKSFTYADMPSVPPAPKLDEKGNPQFTPDGTMYVGGDGNLHPTTGPMQQARQFFSALHPDKQPEISKQPGFWTKWFGSSGAAGGGTAATPGGAATPAAPAMTADTAPEGSYARKGTQWYRKTSGQWQPTSGPAAQ